MNNGGLGVIEHLRRLDRLRVFLPTDVLRTLSIDHGSTMVFEGGTDVAAMQAFVDHLLLPKLRAGDIVVMDDLAAHKSPTVIQRIESAKAKAWFLPTYSPDLNPIEQIWAKVKALLKQFAARADQQLMTAIRKAIQAVTKEDILNSIIHANYVHTNS